MRSELEPQPPLGWRCEGFSISAQLQGNNWDGEFLSIYPKPVPDEDSGAARHGGENRIASGNLWLGSALAVIMILGLGWAANMASSHASGAGSGAFLAALRSRDNGEFIA